MDGATRLSYSSVRWGSDHANLLPPATIQADCGER